MSRKAALPMASSTSSSLLVNLFVVMMLTNMEEQTTMVTVGMALCACSAFSGALRVAQYLVHVMTGIKTY